MLLSDKDYKEYEKIKDKLKAPAGKFRVVKVDPMDIDMVPVVVGDFDDVQSAGEAKGDDENAYIYDDKGEVSEVSKVIAKARIYLAPGQQAPSGAHVQTGAKGGRYYDSEPRQPGEEEAPGEKKPGEEAPQEAQGPADGMLMFKRRAPGQGEEVNIEDVETLKMVLDSGKYALISAGRNPSSLGDKNLDDNMIDERNAALKDDLIGAGYVFSKVLGNYGEFEDSFLVMVHDAEEADIVALGEKYNQESVIVADAGKNKLIYTTGAKKGQMNEGDGWEELPADQKEYFTEASLGEKGEKFKFTLNFDFDKTSPYKSVGPATFDFGPPLVPTKNVHFTVPPEAAHVVWGPKSLGNYPDEVLDKAEIGNVSVVDKAKRGTMGAYDEKTKTLHVGDEGSFLKSVHYELARALDGERKTYSMSQDYIELSGWKQEGNRFIRTKENAWDYPGTAMGPEQDFAESFELYTTASDDLKNYHTTRYNYLKHKFPQMENVAAGKGGFSIRRRGQDYIAGKEEPREGMPPLFRPLASGRSRDEALEAADAAGNKSIKKYMTKARVYIKPGETPPEGASVQEGPRGGKFYEGQGQEAAPETPQPEAPTEEFVLPNTSAEYFEKYPYEEGRIDQEDEGKFKDILYDKLKRAGFKDDKEGFYLKRFAEDPLIAAVDSEGTSVVIEKGDIAEGTAMPNVGRVVEVVEQFPPEMRNGIILRFTPNKKFGYLNPSLDTMGETIASFNVKEKVLDTYAIKKSTLTKRWHGVRTDNNDITKELTVHEMGHGAFWKLPTAVRNKWNKMYAENDNTAPTVYGKTSASEDFAESFMCYLTNNRNKLTPERLEFLQKNVGLENLVIKQEEPSTPSVESQMAPPEIPEDTEPVDVGNGLSAMWKDGVEYWFIPGDTTKSDSPVTTETTGTYTPAYQRRKKELGQLVEKALNEAAADAGRAPMAKAGSEEFVNFLFEAVYGRKFDGISKDLSDTIKEYLVMAVTKKYPMTRVIRYIFRKSGRAITPEHAETIANTEMQALQNKTREWSYKKVDEAGEFKYAWKNPLDHRTTDTCRRLVEKTRNGVALDKLKALVEAESKKSGYEREWTPHINCRSTFVRMR